MTNAQQRKAANKRRKKRRMRRERRYAVALQAVERYIGGLLNEWACTHTLEHRNSQLTFWFNGHVRIAYSISSTLIDALNFKLESRRVRIHASWMAGNGWVFTTTTIDKREIARLQFQTRKIPPLAVLDAIRI